MKELHAEEMQRLTSSQNKYQEQLQTEKEQVKFIIHTLNCLHEAHNHTKHTASILNTHYQYATLYIRPVLQQFNIRVHFSNSYVI